MISTTVTNRTPALALANASQIRAHGRVISRRKRLTRNWSLLLVFFVAPLVMLGAAVGLLFSALG